MPRRTRAEIAESICNQVSRIMEIECIKTVKIQISADLSGETIPVPIINAQVEAFALKRDRNEVAK